MEIAFYNGEFLQEVDEKIIPIQERGHQFGDGVYEVVRVYNNKPFMLEEHLDRFQKSAEAILLQLPYTRQELTEIIDQGVKRSQEKNVDVYFQVTRGIAPRLHLFPNTKAVFSMTIKPSRPIDPAKKESGVAVLLLEDERWKNCYIKSLNLLPNVIAKQHAASRGCDEAILVKDGSITEGSSSNLFVIKDGTIYTTPATKGILHGITRLAVFQLAEKMELPIKEQHFTEEFLLQADEAFITSTTQEILPINKVDEFEIPTHYTITKKLQNEFLKLTK
ncbi:D-amino-acid transaminase [Bacillus suaedaesalsae]|uniref:D-alanine aminotransferase n=1 Tax=Bacillus suaedaesalsae TaxID=2810349 RepID=A0ABS2DLK0_9BACI|nr:D-amino-acid transaminase [Bacillus suaedaesalsae]MBM6619360.1 D-amino-acid transaminase [Bacillus suaedaesalsae]